MLRYFPSSRDAHRPPWPVCWDHDEPPPDDGEARQRAVRSATADTGRPGQRRGLGALRSAGDGALEDLPFVEIGFPIPPEPFRWAATTSTRLTGGAHGRLDGLESVGRCQLRRQPWRSLFIATALAGDGSVKRSFPRETATTVFAKTSPRRWERDRGEREPRSVVRRCQGQDVRRLDTTARRSEVVGRHDGRVNGFAAPSGHVRVQDRHYASSHRSGFGARNGPSGHVGARGVIAIVSGGLLVMAR
jgi:hypothetical protein